MLVILIFPPSLNKASAILVVANAELDVNLQAKSCTASLKLSDGTNEGLVISRYLDKGDDKGIASLVNIFEYTEASGPLTFSLSHASDLAAPGGVINTKGNMVAIVLEDDNVSLPFRVKSGSDATSSTDFVAVAGSSTAVINLTKTASIYITTAFSTFAGTGQTLAANWIIQKSVDGAGFVDISETEITRTVSENIGAATITYMLEDQSAGTYAFQLAHKTNSASTSLSTSNYTFIALGLENSAGNVYPSFKQYSLSGATITSTTYVDAATTSSISSVASNSKAAINLP